MELRPARADEAGPLTELALAAKGHWGYDEAFLAACRDELTVTPQHRATVAERDGRVVGFYTLDGEPPEIELGMMFVAPAEIGTGVGRALWAHAVDEAARAGADRLTIDSEPHAEAFYLAMGAVRVGEIASGSIPGRTLPRLLHRVARSARAGKVLPGQYFSRTTGSSWSGREPGRG
jgi:GNAT superfamily N-acetyltransferase